MYAFRPFTFALPKKTNIYFTQKNFFINCFFLKKKKHQNHGWKALSSHGSGSEVRISGTILKALTLFDKLIRDLDCDL